MHPSQFLPLLQHVSTSNIPDGCDHDHTGTLFEGVGWGLYVCVDMILL